MRAQSVKAQKRERVKAQRFWQSRLRKIAEEYKTEGSRREREKEKKNMEKRLNRVKKKPGWEPSVHLKGC